MTVLELLTSIGVENPVFEPTTGGFIIGGKGTQFVGAGYRLKEDRIEFKGYVVHIHVLGPTGEGAIRMENGVIEIVQ